MSLSGPVVAESIGTLGLGAVDVERKGSECVLATTLTFEW